MARTGKTTRPLRNVYERLSQRLDEVAEREGCYDNTEIIRRMRAAFFASVDALEKSGKVQAMIKSLGKSDKKI
jgi:hypothetical protein